MFKKRPSGVKRISHAVNRGREKGEWNSEPPVDLEGGIYYFPGNTEYN